ncbi:winged helix-turn-helix domain-containing protein [Agromyces archimandritae]|uniref:Helix-turn-helix transcriptional regulator n=1 Tax=Agromyces archimandritae TaxID=2781962 RepID=A0A975INX6_9MICO|nr:helix-turn-helix domain-containing protein [Agromyces archimandritae]QTX05063.1 helix-turn-helix transcriptional regulator [Agromyces archimandritae]
MAEKQERMEAPVASIAVLKAIANPVRQRISRVLSRRGFARAADLADELELPANQISFHLRVLADAGLIVEAPELARDRRDRVWRENPQPIQLGNPENPVADVHLGNVVLQAMAEEVTDTLGRAVVWGADYTSGRTTEIHGVLNSYTLHLAEEEFEELMRDLTEVAHKWQERNTVPGPGVHTWQLHLIAADNEA